MRSRLAAAYRRTGADWPGGDPRPTHGAEMEGWFWRLTDTGTGRVVVALCGVNRSPSGPWATVAVAAHPGGFVRSVAAPTASASAERFLVDVPGVLRADGESLRVELPDVDLDVRFADAVPWTLRTGGGGVFSALPFLGQYWHPHVLDATTTGSITVGSERWDLGGSRLYAEKNWGRGFPEFWWWGQAHGFERDDVTLAFSGGVLEAGPVAAVVGGVVVRIGERILRFTPPFARISADVGCGEWQVAARRRGIDVHAHGSAAGEPHVLPVPVPPERRNDDTDFEHLAAPLELTVREGARTLFAGRTELAGLEIGYRPGHPVLAPRGIEGVRVRSSSMLPRSPRSVLQGVDD